MSWYGCTKSHDIKTDEVALISVMNFKEHELLRDKEFMSSSSVLSRTMEWLKENRDGWNTYLATPAAGKMIISGVGFRMYVGESSVVLNYGHEKDEYRQLSKTI
jgi:hypothetical protein